MADLLPCPFCGSAAKISGGNLRWWVSCTRLGVCIANRPDVAAYSCENKADAIRLWNTRHDHTADLVEALDAIREMTDPDDEDNYRADDREGCFDTVFETARTALSRARNTPDVVGESS